MVRAVQIAETELFSRRDGSGLFVTETAAVAIGGRSVALVASQEFGSQLLAAEVLDDGTLASRVLTDLADAPIPTEQVEALDALALGDRAFVLTVDVDHVATLFELSEDLTLAAVDAADLSNESISTEADLFAAHGTLFVAFERLFARDVVIARVDPDFGFAGLPGPVILTNDDIGGGGLRDIASLSVGPRSFLYVGTNDGIAVAEVARDGSVAIVSADDATPGAVREIVAAEVDGRPYLIVGGDGDQLRSYRVEADGTPTLLQTLDMRAFTVALAEEDGRTFVLVEDRLLELGDNGLLLDLGATQDRAAPSGDAAFFDSVGLSGPNGATFVEFTRDVGLDEIDEGFATRVEVLTGPDLVIDPDDPLTLSEGVRLSLGGTMTFERIGVVNEGDEAATDYGISVFVSLDEAFGTEAELRAGVPILRTEAGAAIGGVGGTVAHQIAVVGDAFLHVFVDPLGEVAETSEDNNVASLRVQITPFTGGDDVVALSDASAFAWRALGGADEVFGSDARDVVNGGAGDDVIVGGRGADVLKGAGGADEISGGVGRDLILGGGRGDELSGNGGRDDIRGARGRDDLSGGGGRDQLNGGGGRDRLEGDRGADVLTGGRGADVFVIGRRDGTDRITDFGDRDTIEITSGAASFAQLQIVRAGDDASVSGRGFTLLLEGVQARSLDAGDFDFV